MFSQSQNKWLCGVRYHIQFFI